MPGQRAVRAKTGKSQKSITTFMSSCEGVVRSSSHDNELKRPLVQVFVRPAGLLWRGAIWVSVRASNDTSTLACTRSLGQCGRLFGAPLELWGEAAGKGAAVPLILTMLSCESAQPLAEAHVRSDELRKLGLYNPCDGAAVALPLTRLQHACGMHERLLWNAVLHCYVHVGYCKRRKDSSTPQSAVNVAGRPRPSKVGDYAHSKDAMASMHIQFAVLPAVEQFTELLAIWGRNIGRSRAVRLGCFDLVLPPGWQLAVGFESAPLLLATLPPRGRIEATCALTTPRHPMHELEAAKLTARSTSYTLAGIGPIHEYKWFASSWDDFWGALCTHAACARLLSPALCPVAVLITASELRVGEMSLIEMGVACPATGLCGDAPSIGRIIEVQFPPSGGWAVLGSYRHRLRMHMAAPVKISTATLGAAIIWHLVPLAAGIVPLPPLRMRLAHSSSSSIRCSYCGTFRVSVFVSPFPVGEHAKPSQDSLKE